MATRAELIQLYLAYFGRPADFDGLKFYENVPFDTVVKAFSASPESTALFGTTFGAAQVNAIYQNLFNRDAEPAGLDYWSGRVNSGAMTAAMAAYGIMVGAQNADKTSVDNKIAIINLFESKLDTAAEIVGYAGTAAAASARAYIKTVTSDAATVTTATTGADAAVAAAVTAGTTGVTGTTFALATTADNLTGTANNDVFAGVAGTGATFTAADLISGGAGTDTLSIVTDANFTVVGYNVTSVERLQVNATAAAAVTFSNVTGVTELVNNASSAALTFGVGAGGSVSSVGTVTINGATANTTVVYTDASVAGATDAATLNLSGYGSATTSRVVTLGAVTAAANELESLTINATGTNGITLTTDGTQTSLKTLTVTGSGSLAMLLAADNIVTSATTINAGAATGAVSIGADSGGTALGAANHTVTLGTGADSVFFGANLNSSDTVDGGTGSDTIGVSAAVTNTIMTNVKGFEVLRLDVVGASITQDTGITSLAGLNYAVVGAANTATLNNLGSGASITVAGTTGVLTGVLKDGSGLTDAISVTGTGSAAGTTLTTLTNVAGLETLNLATGTNAANTFTITTDAVTAAHVVTGAANLTITNALATTSFNASAFTGKLTVLAGNTATNIQAGTAADVVVGGTGADTVSGGTGNDTITNTVSGANVTAADVLAGGAGNDSFRLAGSAVATGTPTVSYALAPTVTDFTVGTSASASDYVVIATNGTAYGAQVVQGTGGTNLTATAAGAVGIVSVAQSGTAALAAANQFIKLTTGVAAGATLQATFNSAIGTSTLTGGTAATTMVGSLFDTTNNKAVIFEVLNTAGTNTTFETGDVIRLIGTVNMTAADYANFGTNNIALVNF